MCGSQIAQMTQIFTLHTLPASEINLRDQRHLREINNKRLSARGKQLVSARDIILAGEK